MEVITMESGAYQNLLEQIESMQCAITNTLAGNLNKPYLNIRETIEYTGLSRTTLDRHRNEIGFSKPGGVVTFTRKDVDKFMNKYYFKASAL